jgi:hypothetical protein
MLWPRTTVTTDRGETREAVAPLIISASRSTDIPAFYGEWFLRRLPAGYAKRTSPFSGRPLYVSFEQARFFVFWSKNPVPFFPFLGEIDKRNIPYYFQITVNDYGKEGLENGLPPLEERIGAFKKLSGLIGRERVMWRFDPLVLTDALSPAELLVRIDRIGRELSGYTERLTVSFISLYARTVRNLENAGIRTRPWDAAGKRAVLRGIGEIAGRLKMRAVACADENDYRRYGILQGQCIDGAIIARLAPGDRELRGFLTRRGGTKDRGQRPHCGCVPSRDIGAYTTCGHACVYCYANTSPRRALRLHRTDSDSIKP